MSKTGLKSFKPIGRSKADKQNTSKQRRLAIRPSKVPSISAIQDQHVRAVFLSLKQDIMYHGVHGKTWITSKSLTYPMSVHVGKGNMGQDHDHRRTHHDKNLMGQIDPPKKERGENYRKPTNSQLDSQPIPG